MMFTNMARPDSISLSIDNNTIMEVSDTKFLGVLVDNQLNWNAHIKHITSKISKSVAILRILRDIFPKHILKTLYQTLTYPYFNYCNLVWGTADDANLLPLIRMQKKCIRIVNRAGYLDHTDPLFKSSKLLNLEQIHFISCAKFIYNCYKTNSCPNFSSRLILNSDVHDYNTQISSNLRTPFERLDSGKKSFLVKGIKIWNKLPDYIKSANSIIYFKSKLKKWVFENALVLSTLKVPYSK